MGFGYLLFGYLITFVLYITVSNLGFGGLALLLGYGLMLLGLWELNRYHRAFAYAKWLLFPLLLTAVYELFRSLDALFLWKFAFFGTAVENVFSWLQFLLLILFNLALLYGIRMISRDLGILHMVTAAIRNSIFVGIYAVLYLVAHFPIQPIQQIQGYFTLPVVLSNVVWIVCNLVLLVACNKNICRAEDEAQPPKPSRFGFLNRLNESYERNRQRSVETTTRDAESFLRKRQEKREQKNRKKKK